MKHLALDVIRFLQETFDPGMSWTVPPSQAWLKKESPSLPKNRAPPEKQFSKQPALRPMAPAFAKPRLKEETKAIPETVIPPVERTEKEWLKPSISSSPLEIGPLSQTIQELFPQFTLHKEPPLERDLRIDPVYKKALSSDIVLFSFREGKESDLLLQNISIALSSHFAPCAVLDAKKWEISQGNFELFFKQAKAKFFIASPMLCQKRALLPFLKEIPASSERFLAEKPFLFLQPFETYFIDPLQKKELWKLLCMHLKKNLPSSASS